MSLSSFSCDVCIANSVDNLLLQIPRSSRGMTTSQGEKMTNKLLQNLEKLHTTELCAVRIKHNLGLKTGDVIGWCKNAILEAAKNIENKKSGKNGENSRKSENKIFRKGKNWYIKTNGCTITVNAYSYTAITAHKEENA